MSHCINEIGLFRANPCATPGNNLLLTDTCDCNQSTACEDVLSEIIAPPLLITTITYKGVPVVLDAPIDPADTAALSLALHNIITEYEVDPLISVAYDPVTFRLDISHIGAGALESITLDNATVIPATRCCDVVTLNIWKLNVVDALVDGAWGGVVVPSAWVAPYAGDPVLDVVEADKLATELETVLFPALGVPFTAPIIVTVDDIAMAYNVQYCSTSDEPVLINGVAFEHCGWKQAFQCA